MGRSENSKFFFRKDILYKSCPSCTNGIGEDIFYPCPDSFGFRSGNLYIQSSCKGCRNTKGLPEKPFENFTRKRQEDRIVPEIRILPLSKDEFEDIEDCLKFLTKQMPERGNILYYRSHNMITSAGSLILFQYDGKIIAYGFFDKEMQFKEDDDQFDKEYPYCYKFIEDSVQTITRYITNKEIKDNFGISLGQGTAKIPINYLPKLMDLIDNNDIPDKIDEKETIDIKTKTLILVDDFKIIGEHEQINLKTARKEKDYVRAYKNQANVGAAGEELVRDYEMRILNNLNKTELAKKVKIVSSDASLGYDVLSFDVNGEEKHIEVKTKNSQLSYLDFYISDNEYQKMIENNNHYIYYVSNLKSQTPLLYVFDKGKLEKKFLKPVMYRVSVNFKYTTLE